MAEDEEVVQISDEEKLKIAQHFLLSSPPGQFQEVLADVRKLLPDGLLTDPLTAGIARAFHAKGKVVSTPSGAKTVVCAQGEVDATHYIDVKSKTAFLFNHLTLASENDGAPAVFDQSLESKREAIQSTLDSRFTARFPAEDSAVSVFSKDGAITIIIVAEKKNLRNFWSGKWTSIWNITFTGEVASIAGEVKIHGHYFEDGNVQLQTSKVLPSVALRYASDGELAASIDDHIQNAESSLQAGLEDVYANMSDETFKSMRRSMPITRTKMDWNVNAVRMVRQVQKK